LISAIFQPVLAGFNFTHFCPAGQWRHPSPPQGSSFEAEAEGRVAMAKWLKQKAARRREQNKEIGKSIIALCRKRLVGFSQKLWLQVYVIMTTFGLLLLYHKFLQELAAVG
jgi:hypothetical protein